MLLPSSFSYECDRLLHGCSLEEGRTPWKATPALPVDHIEAESSVCSISGVEGGFVLVGLDTGVVSAWDSRSRQDAWQVLLN